ncbi:cytochrome c [Paenibacillaceae bacterium]|nr:cytochrome c [Paenibacillaceae bacterium]
MMYKWLMFAIFIAASVLGVYLMLFQLPEKEEVVPEIAFEVPDTPHDADAAITQYAQTCLSCHGDQYQGNMGPALKTVGATMTKEQIYRKIMDGGNGMPPFKDSLSEEEIINLTNWLAEMN